MFDTGRMVPTAARDDRVTRLARLAEARAGVESRFGDRARQGVPVLPGLTGLLPGGVLPAGTVCSIDGSVALAMALAAQASGDGGWCGVVGVPEFGAEAAAELGLELSRVAVAPDPGGHWLTVLDAMADSLGLVIVRPPEQVTSAMAARVGARLRARGSVLLALGDRWPGAGLRFQVSASSWTGAREGAGHLTSRRVQVRVHGRGGAVRAREHEVWLPDRSGRVHPVESVAAVESVRPVESVASVESVAAVGVAGAAGMGSPVPLGWRHEVAG